MSCKRLLTHGLNCRYHGVKLRWIILGVSAGWAFAWYCVVSLSQQVPL